MEEGVAIALEIIEKIKNTPGVDGMHIMAVHWEAIVPRLIEESNLPKPSILSLDDLKPAAVASPATSPVAAAP
jgi:hypothetical protein